MGKWLGTSWKKERTSKVLPEAKERRHALTKPDHAVEPGECRHGAEFDRVGPSSLPLPKNQFDATETAYFIAN